MSYFLALDTATEACSVAISIDGQIRELFEVVDRNHTQRLLPMLAKLASEAGRPLSQLDGIACGIGPGSFAGVRIGVGVVKGLALAADIPVIGVSSLAMIAQRAVREAGAQQVAAVIDARMQEVYVGLYGNGAEGALRQLGGEQVCPPGAVPALGSGAWHGAGSGWASYPDELRAAFRGNVTATNPAALPHAEDALWLAQPRLKAGQGGSADALVPAYLRDRVALTLKEQQASRR